jgi:hypothetical protein
MNAAYEQLIAGYRPVSARFRALLADVGPERAEFKIMFTTIAGRCHGIDHWARVGIYALAIARGLRDQGWVKSVALVPAGALEDAVTDAAFFHDCARASEGDELVHGKNGQRIWRHYAERKGLARELTEAVSQALLFHVDHPSVDPAANEATICLCNADRLDRVRLGDYVDSRRMYDDRVWPELVPHSVRLYNEFRLQRVSRELGLAGE